MASVSVMVPVRLTASLVVGSLVWICGPAWTVMLGASPDAARSIAACAPTSPARAGEVGAQAAIDLAASGLAPNITVQAGPQIQTSDPTTRDAVNLTGTITLTLAILDGGLTQAKVEEARSRLQSAKVTEEQTRQQVELDVRNAYLSLGNAADVLRSALAGQTAAREALRIANV